MIALKIFLLILAGIITILGDLFEYRKDGKFTIIGVTALIVILISVLGAITIEFNQYEEQAVESKKQNERHLQTINESKKIASTQHSLTLNLLTVIDSLHNLNTNLTTAQYLNYLAQQGIIGQLNNTLHVLDSTNKTNNKQFSTTIDSIRKIYYGLNEIRKETMASFAPLSPILVQTHFIIELKEKPFEDFLWSNGIPTDWLEFNNKEDKITYGFWQFPKPKDEERFLNSLLNGLHVSAKIKDDSTDLIIFKEIQEQRIGVEDGAVMFYSNGFSDYWIKLDYNKHRNQFEIYFNFIIDGIQTIHNPLIHKSMFDLEGKQIELDIQFKDFLGDTFIAPDEVPQTKEIVKKIPYYKVKAEVNEAYSVADSSAKKAIEKLRPLQKVSMVSHAPYLDTIERKIILAFESLIAAEVTYMGIGKEFNIPLKCQTISLSKRELKGHDVNFKYIGKILF